MKQPPDDVLVTAGIYVYVCLDQEGHPQISVDWEDEMELHVALGLLEFAKLRLITASDYGAMDL